MIQSVDVAASEDANKGTWTQTSSATRKRLLNLQVLNGLDCHSIISHKWSDTITVSKRHYQNFTAKRHLLNHEVVNVRFNLSANIRPSNTSRCKFGTIMVKQPINKIRFPSRLATQCSENETGLSVNLKTATSLSPAMEFIIENLSLDRRNSFLGSLPMHLRRAAKYVHERSSANLDELSRELSQISYTDFKSKYISTAGGMIKMQTYLDICTRQEAIVVGNIIKNDCEALLMNKYGYSVLRPLIGIHEELSNRIQHLCTNKFNILVIDECASRVIQRLVQYNDSFKEFCLNQFQQNKSLWLKHIEGLFVLATCMKFSDLSEYQFVIDVVFKNTRNLTKSKTMKRVMVSIIEACQDDYLDYIYSILEVESNLIRYLRDKYMTYILIAFLRREYSPVTALVARLIASQLKEMFSKTYFKLLANKLLSIGSDKVLDTINTSLLNISITSLFNLCDGGKNLPNLYYYVFLTISSFRTEEVEGTEKLFEFVHKAGEPAVLAVAGLVALLRRAAPAAQIAAARMRSAS